MKKEYFEILSDSTKKRIKHEMRNKIVKSQKFILTAQNIIVNDTGHENIRKRLLEKKRSIPLTQKTVDLIVYDIAKSYIKGANIYYVYCRLRSIIKQ